MNCNSLNHMHGIHKILYFLITFVSFPVTTSMKVNPPKGEEHASHLLLCSLGLLGGSL